MEALENWVKLLRSVVFSGYGHLDEGGRTDPDGVNRYIGGTLFCGGGGDEEF